MGINTGCSGLNGASGFGKKQKLMESTRVHVRWERALLYPGQPSWQPCILSSEHASTLLDFFQVLFCVFSFLWGKRLRLLTFSSCCWQSFCNVIFFILSHILCFFSYLLSFIWSTWGIFFLLPLEYIRVPVSISSSDI